MQHARALNRVLFKSVDALSRALEARDLYTAGHQTGVSRLARRIAQKLGLDAQTIEGVRVGGLLHDIGKIAIPSEILTMPRRLSAEEMGLVRGHAQHGHDIVRDIEFPWPVAQIVRQHHERADGSGYPSGLARDEILLEARIVGVADVVDSITEHRPYRPALGLDSARAELTSHRGRLYDAAVVDACLAVLAEPNLPRPHSG